MFGSESGGGGVLARFYRMFEESGNGMRFGSCLFGGMLWVGRVYMRGEIYLSLSGIRYESTPCHLLYNQINVFHQSIHSRFFFFIL